MTEENIENIYEKPLYVVLEGFIKSLYIEMSDEFNYGDRFSRNYRSIKKINNKTGRIRKTGYEIWCGDYGRTSIMRFKGLKKKNTIASLHLLPKELDNEYMKIIACRN